MEDNPCDERDPSLDLLVAAQGLPTTSALHGSPKNVIESESQIVSSIGALTQRIIYWNIFGYSNLNDILSRVEESDIICICETWLTTMPDFVIPPFTHIICIPAIRTASFGRASGG